eukprot:COSAG04_NODE_2388_length_4223_cov_7.809166_3_plen_77_part_00
MRLSVSLTPKSITISDNAFLGGGNEAVCNAAPPPGRKERDLPSSPDEVCGGNDNIFQNNFIEHVCFETDDSGAFCA